MRGSATGLPHAIGNWLLITGLVATVLSVVRRLGRDPAMTSTSDTAGHLDAATDKDLFELAYEQIRREWRKRRDAPRPLMGNGR